MRSLQRTPLPLESGDGSLVRDSSLVWLAGGIVGVSFGAVSVAGGLPVWVPVLMSAIVYAGSAQFSAVGVLLAGGGPVAAAVTGLLLNTRTAAFSLAVAEIIGSGRATRLLGAHLVTDETVAFALAQSDPVRRRRAFWISGLGLFAVWNVGVAVGALAGSALGDTARYGLDAAFPAVLVALVLPAVRADAAVRRCALLGAAVALAVTPAVPAGVPVLLALAGLFLHRRPAGRGAAA
ncbi:4-azaleucine resistance probable transporter AzlC [Streptomyces sp. 1222.5]|uniref:AzlC family ABC transporter permease n=1 Tax=unclassified Streptomyces TaxID=2593676 RepID=UPI000895C331|nr:MULTISPECIES: AzlC family ABC transporter permease [unclassified Streptomyces]PKW08399.1 4-azaleucine resistance transporter AzlC [Streptomyces sp. 5112.2]SEC64197.1 4-azaleucine resistance probable transporter AzlC [Streptomyces sp. 1222.5]